MRARSASGGAGEGRGGRVSKSGSRASCLPPSPSFGGVVLPAAGLASSSDWLSGPRKLAFAIGLHSCKFSPYAGWRGRQGGAHRFRPAPQSLAPRPCATWQETRAGGGDGQSVCAAGRVLARFLLEL